LSLGAEEMSRADFVALLGRFCRLPGRPGPWDDGEMHYPSPGHPDSGALGRATS
jgi:leucyl/phenylalanyl-tRNA--protein transferase